MITKKNDFIRSSLLPFSPYIIFLVTYISLYYYTLHATNTYNSHDIILSRLPLFAVFIAILYAFFTYKEHISINKKIEIFFSGVADIHAINYYFNIICTTIFNYMVAKTNGVLIAVTLSLLYIKSSLIMPILFLISSIISIIIPSLLTVIMIFMPIGYGIAQSLQINLALMAATIISGALFGSHITLYFNSFPLLKPINLNIFHYKSFWLIITSASITLCILTQYQNIQIINPTLYDYLQTTLTFQSSITIIPYFCLLLGSMLQIPLIINLIFGSCFAFILEIVLHEVLFLDAIAIMLNGFYKESIIINILFLHMVIAGLTKIIKHNGGFNYIIEKLQVKKNPNILNIQIFFILITFITNILVIIDTLCFNLIINPIKKIGDIYHIPQKRIENLIYITITTTQTMMPYTSIMMITMNINHVSYVEVLKYMIYPLLIIIFTIISIIFSIFHTSHKYNHHQIIK